MLLQRLNSSYGTRNLINGNMYNDVSIDYAVRVRDILYYSKTFEGRPMMVADVVVIVVAVVEKIFPLCLAYVTTCRTAMSLPCYDGHVLRSVPLHPREGLPRQTNGHPCMRVPTPTRTPFPLASCG